MRRKYKSISRTRKPASRSATSWCAISFRASRCCVTQPVRRHSEVAVGARDPRVTRPRRREPQRHAGAARPVSSAGFDASQPQVLRWGAPRSPERNEPRRSNARRVELVEGSRLTQASLDRSSFIATLTVGRLAAPLVAEGQPAEKVWRIGYLSPAVDHNNPIDQAFDHSMQGSGYIEGRNLRLLHTQHHRPDVGGGIVGDGG